MKNPFKSKEVQPLNAPIIEMRKNSGGYFWWIVGTVLVIIVLVTILTR